MNSDPKSVVSSSGLRFESRMIRKKSRFYFCLAAESSGEEKAAKNILHQQHIDWRALLPGFALEVQNVGWPAVVDVCRCDFASELRRRRVKLPAALFAGDLFDKRVGHIYAALRQGSLELGRAGIRQLLVQGRHPLAQSFH